MTEINRSKAEVLNRLPDGSNGFYRGRVEAKDCSLMNVTFNLADPELEKCFIDAAQSAGFSGLAGHRSTGSIRASIYNGLSLTAAEKLVGFMEDFRHKHS